jgi:Cu-Zn family superoxide dismutase
LTLYTNKTIIGRSVIVHEKPDDLGRGNTPDSPKTGNSGPRIGCGVIKAVGISVKAKP